MTVDGADGWEPVRICKSRFNPNQELLNICGTVNIAGTSDVTLPIYTVPAGYVASISSFWIMCETDDWHKFTYMVDGAETGYACYKRMFSFTDAEIGTFPHVAGTVLQAKLYNANAAAKDFYLTAWGTKEKA